MQPEHGIIAAFMIGLLGSTHCIGMCGGIAGAFTLGLPGRVRQSPLKLLLFLLSYNSGRLLSYTVAGLIVGYVSGAASGLFHIHFPVGGLIGGLFMIALGIYIAGWYPTLQALEKLGGKLYFLIEPYGRRLMPVTTLYKALALGTVWGWLPCGLVYSTLAWSATTGSATHSALLMLAFGVGTLPMLLAMGGLAHRLQRITRHKWTRYLAGLLLIAFGLLILFRAFSGGQHMH